MECGKWRFGLRCRVKLLTFTVDQKESDVLLFALSDNL
jgi:hypothetical protein